MAYVNNQYKNRSFFKRFLAVIGIIITITSFIASIIGIFVFLSGKADIETLFNSRSVPTTTIQVFPTPTVSPLSTITPTSTPESTLTSTPTPTLTPTVTSQAHTPVQTSVLSVPYCLVIGLVTFGLLLAILFTVAFLGMLIKGEWPFLLETMISWILWFVFTAIIAGFSFYLPPASAVPNPVWLFGGLDTLEVLMLLVWFFIFIWLCSRRDWPLSAETTLSWLLWIVCVPISVAFIVYLSQPSATVLPQWIYVWLITFCLLASFALYINLFYILFKRRWPRSTFSWLLGIILIASLAALIDGAVLILQLAKIT